MIENISQSISYGHSVANNPSCYNYNNNKPIKYIIDFDMNNEYGKVMQSALSYGNINDADKSMIDFLFININNTTIGDENSKIGAICGVDLEIPKHLHIYFKDFPLAPVHREGKLYLTLEDKINYGVHIICLKYYLSKGLILKKFIGLSHLTKNLGLNYILS
jgi:hypothetical protein